MTAADVIRAAMELAPDEREEVARTLLSSLGADVEQSNIDKAWRVEVERRVQEIRQGEVRGMTRDELSTFLSERRAARSA